MRKWDSISWAATALVTISAFIAGFTGNDIYLFFTVLAYFLRPTLHAFGVAKHQTDERELSIGYRSGNIALMAVIITAVLLALKHSSEGKPTDDLNTIIIVGIAARALAGILMSRSYLETGVRISTTIGLVFIAFGIAEGGLAPETLQHTLPGLFFIALGYVGKRYPMVGAVVYGLLGITAFIGISFILKSTFSIYQLITGTLIGVPLGAVSYCFYRGRTAKTASEE